MLNRWQSKLVSLIVIVLNSRGRAVMAETASDRLASQLMSQVNEGSIEAVPPLFGEDQQDKDNVGTNQTGLLKIDRVPNITFGQVVPSGLYQKEYAQNSNPYIQVSDLRGNLGGWTLSGKISSFVSKPTPEDPKKYLLNGATLTFHQGQMKQAGTGYAEPPTSYSVGLNKNYQKMLVAEKETGQGIWASSWQNQGPVNQGIELSILPGTVKENRNYSATLYWQLTDVPQPTK